MHVDMTLEVEFCSKTFPTTITIMDCPRSTGVSFFVDTTLCLADDDRGPGGGRGRTVGDWRKIGVGHVDIQVIRNIFIYTLHPGKSIYSPKKTDTSIFSIETQQK